MKIKLCNVKKQIKKDKTFYKTNKYLQVFKKVTMRIKLTNRITNKYKNKLLKEKII